MRTIGLAFVCFILAGSAAAERRISAVQAPQSIECIAVFELMQRISPNWMTQASVEQAWSSWEAVATNLALQAEVDFGDQVQREMLVLADEASSRPDALKSKALSCVSSAPVF